MSISTKTYVIIFAIIATGAYFAIFSVFSPAIKGSASTATHLSPSFSKLKNKIDCKEDEKCLKRLDNLEKKKMELLVAREAQCLRNPICSVRLKNTKKRQQKLYLLCEDDPRICAQRIGAYVMEREKKIDSYSRLNYSDWCKANEQTCKDYSQAEQETVNQWVTQCEQVPEYCAQELARLDSNYTNN